MLAAQPAPVVTANANSATKKPCQGTDSFARALSEGLIDVAFAFDGAFRPADSMSLAERAAYGLRSNGRTVTHRTISAHGAPGTFPTRQVVSVRAPRQPNAAPRVIGRARIAIAAPSAAALEEVRREARLRHASSSDVPPNRACRYRAIGCPGLRVSAIVGAARLDVVVISGGRLASAMQWMR